MPTRDPLVIPETCVVFDTETTGTDASQDKIVEIGAVLFEKGLPTSRTFHAYINPERQIDVEATAVHGLTNARLANEPLFREVWPKFFAFIDGRPLVAHNAKFDRQFLKAECLKAGFDAIPYEDFVDSLEVARRRFPGSPASLDALAKRFKISLAGREKHGALIDSQILAEICVELRGGRQMTMIDGLDPSQDVARQAIAHGPRPRPLIRRASDEERAAHAEFVKGLGPNSLWAKMETESADKDAA